jgi:hypothetical protein
MKYNIIGDIHSREWFTDVVLDDAVNVFVGDYFSPYDRIDFSKQVEVFCDVLSIKKAHPETTVLLIGNHDEDHWHIRERYSRFDWKHVEDITDMFEVDKDLFQAAYSINNKYLITHAGVTAPWFCNAKAYMEGTKQSPYPLIEPNNIRNISVEGNLPIDEAYKAHMKAMVKVVFDGENAHKDEMEHPKERSIVYTKDAFYLYLNGKYTKITSTPDECSALINKAWKEGNYHLFDFRSNCDPWDGYGDSYTQGPLWVRPETLCLMNIFKGTPYKQIVGHTQFKKPYYHKDDGVGFCDCLGTVCGSIIIDTDKEEGEKISVNIKENK